MPTSTPALRVWLALVLAAAWAGCGAAQGSLRSDASLSAAEHYDTGERPEPVLGARDPDAYLRAVANAAREAGVALRGDGRLARLARRYAGECAGADPGAVADDARALGLIEPTFELACVGENGRGGTLLAALAAELGRRLRAGAATHFGLFVAEGESGATLVLGRRALALAPVSQRLDVGAVLHVRGRLDAVFAHPRLVVRGPEGERSWPAGVGPDFDLQVPLPAAGCYALAIAARAGDRAQTLAELTVRAGDGEGACTVVRPAPARVAPALRAQARELAFRIAELRRASALPALASSAQLERAAEQASARAAVHAVAEPPPARELGSGLVLLAVARTADEARLWDAFTRDAGLRAKLLNPDVTHVGVSVRAGRGEHVAAVMIAQLASPVADLDLAPARVLEAINRNRGARSVPALRPDPALTRVAQDAARAFFAQPTRGEREIIAHANAELERFGLSYRRVAAVAVLVSDPLEAAALEPALDAAAGAAGIAVATGTRPGTSPSALAVVIALGWDR